MTKLRVSPTGLLAVLLAGLVSASVMVTAQAGGPVLAAPVVAGPSITFTWTAVPGATAYVLRAGVVPGVYQIAVNVGNTLSAGAAAPAVGTYYARVEAVTPTGTLPSNEQVISVTTLSVPPAAPTNFEAFVNGRTALLTWTPSTGAGNPTGYVLHAGSTSGASDQGIFPIALGSQLAVPNVNAGNYFLRMFAVNGAGASPASNEVPFNMPVGGGCSEPPARTFTAAAFGRYIQFLWSPVPGASGYRLDFSTTPGGPVILSQPMPPNATQFAATGAPLGTFYGRLTTQFSCGSQKAGAEVGFTIDGAPPPGPRAANPPAGQRLPFPNWGADIVRQLAAERPDLLNQSCHEAPGGNNRFMFEAVRRLRARDNRFGLNWKRGLVGDLSQDIVNYNYSSDSDEGTRNAYIIDMIGGHCGPRPSWAWIDQTEPTRSAGTVGIWTLLPYIQAGFPIVSDQTPQ